MEDMEKVDFSDATHNRLPFNYSTLGLVEKMA